MTEDTNAALREEVTQQLRLLCMGRINAAHRLAELLVPAAPGEAAALQDAAPLPVVDPSMLDAEPAQVEGQAAIVKAKRTKK